MSYRLKVESQKDLTEHLKTGSKILILNSYIFLLERYDLDSDNGEHDFPYFYSNEWIEEDEHNRVFGIIENHYKLELYPPTLESWKEICEKHEWEYPYPWKHCEKTLSEKLQELQKNVEEFVNLQNDKT